MKVMVEECFGMPKEGTEEFQQYISLIRELSLILQPKTPLILYEKFFITLLEKEEMTLNTLIKTLVSIILLEKYEVIESETKKEILLN
jgi:hypothetical protein